MPSTINGVSGETDETVVIRIGSFIFEGMRHDDWRNLLRSYPILTVVAGETVVQAVRNSTEEAESIRQKAMS